MTEQTELAKRDKSGALTTLLTVLVADWQRQRRTILKQYGITPNQYRVLQAAVTAKRQHPGSQQFIVVHTGMNKMVVSQAVDALNRKLLLTRINDFLDTRKNTLRLTNKGKSYLEKITLGLQQLEEEFFANLEAGECSKFKELVEKLGTF